MEIVIKFFVDIIGHKTQWDLLLKLLTGTKMPQAFLFTGDSFLGKRKVALEFIKTLNCEKRFQKPFLSKPCLVCSPCLLIENKKHPDFITIEPREKEIQIDQIRDLQKWLSFKTQLSSFKLALIEDAEALNAAAQNCFLKTLEEPKGKTIFFLITAHPEMLFKTIRSRCEELKFYPVSSAEMRKSLELKLAESKIPLEDLIRASEGKPGRAINFLENPQKFFSELNGFKEISKFLKLGVAGKFAFAGDCLSKDVDKNSLNPFLDNFIRYLRILLFQKLGLASKLLNFNSEEDVKEYSFLKLKKMIEAVENLKFLLLTTNINQKLAFENLMLQM